MDETIADIDAIMQAVMARGKDARAAEDEEREARLSLVKDEIASIMSHDDEIGHVCDLAEACLENGIPMWSRLSAMRTAYDGRVADGYVIADGVTHEVGFIVDNESGHVRGIGRLDEPSVIVIPSSRAGEDDHGVFVTKDDSIGWFGASRDGHVTKRMPWDDPVAWGTLCRFGASIDGFMSDFVAYAKGQAAR